MTGTPEVCTSQAHPRSGHGAAWLARLHGVQEVEGSNPFAPTISIVRRDAGFRANTVWLVFRLLESVALQTGRV